MSDLVLSATFEVDGYTRRLDVFGDRLRDISAPLARIGGFAKAQAKKRFDAGGPGWAPLSKETIARKPSAVAIAFFRKRRHGGSASDEVVRLGKRYTAQLGVAAGASQRLTQALGIAEAFTSKKGAKLGLRLTSKATKDRDKALAKATALGEDLHGLVEQFGNGRAVGATDIAGLVAAAEKEQRRRGLHQAALAAARLLPAGSKERRRVARVGSTRYRNSSRSLQLLGSLRDAIHLYVDGGRSVVIFAGPSWSGVQNKGGTVGHGAVIPARTYLIIDGDTINFAVITFEAYMLEPFVGDAGA